MTEVHYCEWCNARAHQQCDGKLPNGKTCDRWMCRSHAKMMALVHGQDRKTGRRFSDTRDLCPDCVQNERTIWPQKK